MNLGSPIRWPAVPRGVAALTCLALACAASDGLAQSEDLDTWRFPVGERMEYSVNWAGARIGTSVLTVEAIDTIAGTPAYRASLHTEGGPPFYRLDDRLTSWIRPEPFATLRFDQRLRQGNYRRDRRHFMDPEAGTYTRFDLEDGDDREDGGDWTLNESEHDVPIPPGALDDVAYFYFARLKDLEVGERYEYERYFKDTGNPVILEVLRRERVRVPAGTFNTIVVRPIIKTSGLFSEGGEAELYLTDDDRRIPVRVKTKLSIGTGNFYLVDYDPGDPGRMITAAAGEAPGSP